MSRTGDHRRVTFGEILANREFRALFAAQGVSVIGNQLAVIAVSVLVFDHTHSAVLAALTFAIAYLPWLVGGPVLSSYADRLPRRNVMLVCESLRAAIFAAMAAGHLPVGVLLGAMLVASFLDPPFASARAAMLPDIVGEGDRYAVAATLNNVSNQIEAVVGFAIGGAAVAALGARPSLLLDALSFALSAAVTARFITSRPPARISAGSWLDDLRGGAAVVFGDAQLRWLVITSWLFVGMSIANDGVVVPFAHDHGHGSAAIGLLGAAIPAGSVVGGLILGRVVSLPKAERLMAPMALTGPLVFALTGFNPSIPVTIAIWLVTGVFGAMTITANRIFVQRTPADRRGQAFGIAVAGFNGAQGLGALLAGALAAHLGPAHAVAAIALPAFALIAIFTATNGYRKAPRSSMSDVTPAQDETEEKRMPISSGRPSSRVLIFISTLVVVAAGLALSVSAWHVYSAARIDTVWLLFLFVVGMAYPVTFEFRRQTWVILLETEPLVFGLFFLSPIHLVLIRAGAMLVTHAVIRRQPAVRWVFNAASTTATTSIAVVVFHALSRHHDGVHPGVWPAVFIAVLVDAMLSSALVAVIISINDQVTRFKESVRILAFSALVSAVATCLAIALASALSYEPATFWIITVFLLLFIAAMRTYRRLEERTNALDRLYVMARELGPIAGDPRDVAPALIQLRRIVSATRLELLVLTSSDQTFATEIEVHDDPETGTDQVSISERALDLEVGGNLGLPTPGSWLARLPRPAVRSRHYDDRMSTEVSIGDRRMGVLSAHGRLDKTKNFERSDLRLLEAAADQLAAALEKGRLVESLRRAATRDSLTSLANLDSLRTFLATMLDGGSGGVLLLLNIDRFHEVNDMLGHDAGDAVLVEVARRLDSAPSHGALSARVGGDQFALALPGAAGSEVARLAALAVKSRVDGSLRFSDVSADVRVTVGVARAPDHGNDAATLLRRAEMAMVAAKGTSSGLGEWEPSYERDGSRRLQLLVGLRAALADNSLTVEYQPKLLLGGGEVVGFEALVRWRHPELGPVSPAEFIPLAEATGLIPALTSKVLRDALDVCRSWHDAGKPVGVAVNISARSLDDPVLVGQVAAMLTASGVEPQWLTLEITESSVMENHTRAIDVLRQLRMLGVRLSIDDFGTGYSSLHQLRGLPAHELKIDRSFVETVDSDGADRAVVKAIVELCASLGLVSVAEGVETAGQAFALEALGVDQVQGYFHSRPMTPAAAIQWLTPRRTARPYAPESSLPGQRSRGQDTV